MYLLDTNVISELRKGLKAHPGVVAFFTTPDMGQIYLPVQVIGEIRSGIARLRERGDSRQGQMLENWLYTVLQEYGERVLVFDADCAQVWGALMAGSDQNPVDKQIAAIALINDLIVVTRNGKHFAGTGVQVLDPFAHQVEQAFNADA